MPKSISIVLTMLTFFGCAKQPSATQTPVERGKYLVSFGGSTIAMRRRLRAERHGGARHVELAFWSSGKCSGALFSVFHNAGFVSGVGLLDHLSGTHKVLRDAAAAICPDGIEACGFPSY
jgi:hypothetical protein